MRVDNKWWLVLILGLFAVAAVLILTGCGTEPVGLNAPDRDYMQKLEDGTEVHCVYVTQGSGNYATGGPSCDWVGYHQAYDRRP